jgi:hypothetical protein
MPAFNSNWWEGVSASAGFSRNVLLTNLDNRNIFSHTKLFEWQ